MGERLTVISKWPELDPILQGELDAAIDFGRAPAILIDEDEKGGKVYKMLDGTRVRPLHEVTDSYEEIMELTHALKRNEIDGLEFGGEWFVRVEEDVKT